MSEKCKNTDCDFWDDLFEDNCGGEIGGESASATCDRKGKPSYENLARENARLMEMVKANVGDLFHQNKRLTDELAKTQKASTEYQETLKDVIKENAALREALERIVKADKEIGKSQWSQQNRCALYDAIYNASELLAGKGERC